VSDEYVVDASIAASALVYKTAVGIAASKRVTDSTCHAPHLIDAEVGQVLRRGVRKDEFTEHTARTALAALPQIIDHRYPHTGRLSLLAWELRHTITFYDGLYVALATMLEVPLLTTDVKLSNAPGLSCTVEVLR
jgi:predicted nucleic acid-binding protein